MSDVTHTNLKLKIKYKAEASSKEHNKLALLLKDYVGTGKQNRNGKYKGLKTKLIEMLCLQVSRVFTVSPSDTITLW